MQMYDMERHRYLCQLALGPLRLVNTWPMFIVNGYKFHTGALNGDKKTYNCEVCAKGVGEDGIENDFYGILKQVVEIKYPGEPIKSVFCLVVTGLIIPLIMVYGCIKILVLYRLDILDAIGNMIHSYLRILPLKCITCHIR